MDAYFRLCKLAETSWLPVSMANWAPHIGHNVFKKYAPHST